MKTKILKIGLTVTMSAIMLLSNLNVTNVFASINSESMDVSTTDSMIDTLPATIRDNYSYEIGPDGNKYIVYDNNFLNNNNSDTTEFFELKTYASSNSTYTEGDFSYIVQDGYAYLSKYNGSAANLTVPSSLGGYPLKGVLYCAFYNNNLLKSLSFSEGLVSLQAGSIYHCENLSSIYFPSTFDYDGGYAGFGGIVWECANLSTIDVSPQNQNVIMYDGVMYTFDKKSLLLFPSGDQRKSFRIPDGVEIISSNSCSYNSHVEEIIMPNSVKKIGYWAFCEDRALSKLNISTNCDFLGQFSIESTGLTTLNIPASMELILPLAIELNSYLESINVDANNSTYHSVDGVLFNTTGLLAYPAAKRATEYTVPSGIVYIGENAFYGAVNLRKVTLPNSITVIERSAFMSCSNLIELNMPNSINTIDKYAFSNDSGLQNIVLPLSLEIISQNLLSYTQSVTIQQNVTEIDTHSFFNFLETVYFTGNAPINIENILSAANNRKLTVYYPSGNSTWNNIIANNSNGNITWKEHKHSSDSRLVTDSGNPCTGSGTVSECCTVCGAVKQISAKNQIGHSYNEVIVAATTDKDGSKTGTCTMCHEQVVNKTIRKIKFVSLNTTTYTYNGSSKKPGITVKDSKGKKIDKKYYTVTYKNNKKVGQATVIVKFKDNYSGTIKKTFTIKPKNTSITNITAGSKSFKVKWKKQSSQTDGYEIQYSTNKKFSKKTSVTIKKNKTTSKVIKKLKAKKKYYVRVRTYKTVKINGKSKKIYSSWSKVKTVTTKK